MQLEIRQFAITVGVARMISHRKCLNGNFCSVSKANEIDFPFILQSDTSQRKYYFVLMK